VTFIKQKLDEGEPLEKAVREGCLVRLRPVLMTPWWRQWASFRWRSTWAWAVKCSARWPPWLSAGIVTNTVLTLLVLPTLYTSFRKRNVVERSVQPEAVVEV